MLDKITKRDILFKIMFALQLAMLPLIIAFRLMFNNWCVAGVISVILIAKLVMIVVKNPADNKHLYLDAVANFVVLTFCLITFCCYNYINVALTCVVCSFFLLEEIAKIYFFYKPNNQIVEGLNFACELFLFTTISSLLLVEVNSLVLTVSSVALLISCLFLVAIQGYKFVYYYIINNQNKKRY